MIITTFEQFKNLPYNRGKDYKTVYNSWLLEEAKLLMMYDSIQMHFQMQNNNAETMHYGPYSAAAGGSGNPIPPLPTGRVTYYTPNGSYPTPNLNLGYYTPDIDDIITPQPFPAPNNTSYYVYVNG